MSHDTLPPKIVKVCSVRVKKLSETIGADVTIDEYKVFDDYLKFLSHKKCTFVEASTSADSKSSFNKFMYNRF